MVYRGTKILYYEPSQQEPSKSGTIVVTLIWKSVAYLAVGINQLPLQDLFISTVTYIQFVTLVYAGLH